MDTLLAKNYRVFYIDHGYGTGFEFVTLGHALQAAKDSGFDSSIIDRDGAVVAGWDRVNGSILFALADATKSAGYY